MSVTPPSQWRSMGTPTSTNDTHPMRAVAACRRPGPRGWDAETRRTVAALFTDRRLAPCSPNVVPWCLTASGGAGRDGLTGAPTRRDRARSGTGIYSDLVAVWWVQRRTTSPTPCPRGAVRPAARLAATPRRCPSAPDRSTWPSSSTCSCSRGDRLGTGPADPVWVNVSGPDTPIHLTTTRSWQPCRSRSRRESTAGAGTVRTTDPLTGWRRRQTHP